MPSTKLLCRAARHLHAVLLARSAQATELEQGALERLDECQQGLRRAGQRLRKARAHRLSLTLPVLRSRLQRRAQEVRDALDRLASHLGRPAMIAPTIATLVAELRQLRAEFDGLCIDWKRQVLSATTEPITLQGVYLGPFAIEFCWERLARHADSHCFDIVALDPHPASQNDLVTHPHVKDQTLCAGAAALPVQHALEQGRLADAFCLVRGVLSHYNVTSPHAPLEEWDGVECYDCGTSIESDDVWHCRDCLHDLCPDCRGECATCGRVTCSDCGRRCGVCAEPSCDRCLRPSVHSARECCRRCLRACPACGSRVAKDELGEDGQGCPACRERQRNAAHSTPSSVPTSEPENPHANADPVAAAP